MRRVLIVFAREPEAGTAKTRLAPYLLPGARVAFYTAMLRDLADVARATECDERILFWSSSAQPHRLEAIFDGFAFSGQSEGSLGDRMANAFSFSFERADAAILVGSDAPFLTSGDLGAAFRALETSDLVLCPAFDGGFCLIGVREAFNPRLPALFRGVEWSASAVFETVLSNYLTTREMRDTFALLPMTFDVDTPEDFDRLRVQIRAKQTAGHDAPRHLQAFFDAFFCGQ